MGDVTDRWPMAYDERRIPMRASKGATEDASAALAEEMYLIELDRQARIFNRSFFDAMRAALVTGDDEECWRHLQASLFAAIIVNRLVDPVGVLGAGWATKAEGRAVAETRSRRLRELVGLPDPEASELPVYAVRNVRNAMEHIDERLDRIAQSGAELSMSDWYVSDGRLLVVTGADHKTAPTGGLRSFVATAGRLFFNDESVDMFELDLQMLAIRNNIREAMPGVKSRLRGRFTFGGTQVVEFSDAIPRVAALASWETERRSREDALTGQVDAEMAESPPAPDDPQRT